MYYILVLTSLTVFLLPLNVSSFNTKARFAEWGVDNDTDDEIGNFLKSISEDNDITILNRTSEFHERLKRSAAFDSADQRKGNTKILIRFRSTAFARNVEFLTWCLFQLQWPYGHPVNTVTSIVRLLFLSRQKTNTFYNKITPSIRPPR